jgi:DNA-binding response OmpR family regulator
MDTLKVLIVDSETEINAFYTAFLDFAEFETKIVNTTDMALRTIATNLPDLVVADVPELKDGFRISELAEKFSIPIIFASRFKNIEFEQLPKIARIINKPFKGLDLRFAVRAAIAKNDQKKKKL